MRTVFFVMVAPQEIADTESCVASNTRMILTEAIRRRRGAMIVEGRLFKYWAEQEDGVDRLG